MSAATPATRQSDRDLAQDVTALEQALTKARAGFSLKRVPLSATDDWGLVDGAIQHRSRGFFSITGARQEGAGRKDETLQRVILYQPQAALNGLLSTRLDGERYFLLQARAEPGNVNEAQFGPTVQSTPANYLRMQGGAGTPYIETFLQHDPAVALLADTTQLDLGERYVFKTKRLISLETRQRTVALPCFIWAGRAAVYQALARSTFMNTDLRSMLAVAEWSAEAADGELTPRCAEVRRSLAAPIRPEVLGALEAALLAAPPRRTDLVGLDGMANWRFDEWGLHEDAVGQGFGVEFFEVSAAYREVRNWIQPLIDSGGEGSVVLACRTVDGMTEVFVQPLAEFGLATGIALAPSYLQYPGTVADPPDWLKSAEFWLETLESDEGGRFHKDASRYRIVKVAEDAPQPPPNLGFWLRVSEVKHCLKVSNRCAIQLRCILSHLLSVS